MGFVKNLVFVIMPFSPNLDKTYLVIKKACDKLGLISVRADEILGCGNINDECKKFIIDAEFIICDLTMERPNVYFELGYCFGVGNENLDVFLISREETKLHFDVHGFRNKKYKSNQHLSRILRTDFCAMIQERRKTKN